MGIFGWSYPPGAENDPYAPYNQDADEESDEEPSAGVITNRQGALDFWLAADESRARMHVYRYTACGAWLEFTETGLKLGSIVEGSDCGTATYELFYPFTEAEVEDRIAAIENEADAIWKWANEENGEWGTPMEQGCDFPDVAFDYRHLHKGGSDG
jgi:hypothetical protein